MKFSISSRLILNYLTNGRLPLVDCDIEPRKFHRPTSETPFLRRFHSQYFQERGSTSPKENSTIGAQGFAVRRVLLGSRVTPWLAELPNYRRGGVVRPSRGKISLKGWTLPEGSEGAPRSIDYSRTVDGSRIRSRRRDWSAPPSSTVLARENYKKERSHVKRKVPVSLGARTLTQASRKHGALPSFSPAKFSQTHFLGVHSLGLFCAWNEILIETSRRTLRSQLRKAMCRRKDGGEITAERRGAAHVRLLVTAGTTRVCTSVRSIDTSSRRGCDDPRCTVFRW